MSKSLSTVHETSGSPPNGLRRSEAQAEPAVDDLIRRCGLTEVTSADDTAGIETALRQLAALLQPADRGPRQLARARAIQHLKRLGVHAPAGILDAFIDDRTRFDDQQSFEPSNGPPEVPFSAEVRSVLQDSNPIRNLVDAIRRSGFVGDIRPAVLTYLAMTSRLLDRPMNLVLIGISSAGKNRTVDAASALVPPEAVYVVRAGSERALIYADEDFQHRVVLFSEADSIPEEGPAASAIRSLASDNVLAYDVVEKNPDTGRHEVRRIEKPGPTALVTTSTRSLKTQLGTRLLEVGVGDDVQQTREVMRAHARNVSGVMATTVNGEQSLIAAQRWLAQHGGRRVVIPFAGALADTVSANQVRMRRDFRQLLSCIQASALLQQLRRDRSEIGQVVASLEDYAISRWLLTPIFDSLATDGVTPAIRQTVESVPEGETVSQAELGQTLKLAASTVSYRVKRAIKGGWLKNLEVRAGHPARLQRGEPLPEEACALPHPQTVRKWYELAYSQPSPSPCSRFEEVFDRSNALTDPKETPSDPKASDVREDPETQWIDLK